MKKIIALLLVICTCLSFSACFSKTEPATEPTTKTIELNKDNISEYLNVKITEYKENNKRRAKVEIYPLKAGDFSDTKVFLKIQPSSGWNIWEIPGEKYEEYDKDTSTEYVVIEIKLPANGMYEIDLGITNFVGGNDFLKKWEFQNVSGTFTPR